MRPSPGAGAVEDASPPAPPSDKPAKRKKKAAEGDAPDGADDEAAPPAAPSPRRRGADAPPPRQPAALPARHRRDPDRRLRHVLPDGGGAAVPLRRAARGPRHPGGDLRRARPRRHVRRSRRSRGRERHPRRAGAAAGHLRGRGALDVGAHQPRRRRAAVGPLPGDRGGGAGAGLLPGHGRRHLRDRGGLRGLVGAGRGGAAPAAPAARVLADHGDHRPLPAAPGEPLPQRPLGDALRRGLARAARQERLDLHLVGAGGLVLVEARARLLDPGAGDGHVRRPLQVRRGPLGGEPGARALARVGGAAARLPALAAGGLPPLQGGGAGLRPARGAPRRRGAAHDAAVVPAHPPDHDRHALRRAHGVGDGAVPARRARGSRRRGPRLRALARPGEPALLRLPPGAGRRHRLRAPADPLPVLAQLPARHPRLPLPPRQLRRRLARQLRAARQRGVPPGHARAPRPAPGAASPHLGAGARARALPQLGRAAAAAALLPGGVALRRALHHGQGPGRLRAAHALRLRLRRRVAAVARSAAHRDRVGGAHPPGGGPPLVRGHVRAPRAALHRPAALPRHVQARLHPRARHERGRRRELPLLRVAARLRDLPVDGAPPRGAPLVAPPARGGRPQERRRRLPGDVVRVRVRPLLGDADQVPPLHPARGASGRHAHRGAPRRHARPRAARGGRGRVAPRANVARHRPLRGRDPGRDGGARLGSLADRRPSSACHPAPDAPARR